MIKKRDVIASNYGETLFVEAGAGWARLRRWSGESRNSTFSDEVSVDNLAVITFTNKAATELGTESDLCLEDLSINCSEPEELKRIRLALEKLDGAAISTLHGFARRLLTDNAIEVGLPPSFEVLDEISSQVNFYEI